MFLIFEELICLLFEMKIFGSGILTDKTALNPSFISSPVILEFYFLKFYFLIHTYL